MGSLTTEVNGNPPSRPVLFFDIDNCLYPQSKAPCSRIPPLGEDALIILTLGTKVHDMMAKLIDEYFSKHLGLSKEDAIRLHTEYYKNYGLAIEGLVRYHQIDPLEYNARVDDALPLEGIIKPNPQLRKMLENIDKSKVKLWLLTNAYVNHARRVVKLLGIDDLFDGLTYCDYTALPFVCKPSTEMYAKAMREAGAESFEACYFVDDSYANCAAAQKLGWTAAHLVEEGLPVPKVQASKYQIQHLEELRTIYSQFFKPSA
ncbi:Haloacid dehalogenase-like hydrolase-domain-containing protein [Xylaria intraflava]|nr:Haloacid dehalogenase-like hydrolase-domain-containing protein [Xylaria intraflava]